MGLNFCLPGGMDPRKSLILKSCRTPKTYEELAEELDAGYYTVRTIVQQLIEAGVLDETPFCRRGTRQKQFVTRAYSKDKIYTKETCAVFNYLKKEWTAMELISSPLERTIGKMVIDIVFSALSAPMDEVITDPSMVGAPHSSVVETRLMACRELLGELLSLTEQMIHSGVWGDREAAKILFDVPPETINTTKILEAKARLFEIANERGW